MSILSSARAWEEQGDVLDEVEAINAAQTMIVERIFVQAAVRMPYFEHALESHDFFISG